MLATVSGETIHPTVLDLSSLKRDPSPYYLDKRLFVPGSWIRLHMGWAAGGQFDPIPASIIIMSELSHTHRLRALILSGR